MPTDWVKLPLKAAVKPIAMRLRLPLNLTAPPPGGASGGRLRLVKEPPGPVTWKSTSPSPP